MTYLARLAALRRRRLAAPSFTCPACQMTSHNPCDIAEGYCGNCHDWTRGRVSLPPGGARGSDPGGVNPQGGEMLRLMARRPDTAPAVPGGEKCDAMIGHGEPDEQKLRWWLTEADKCMQPATLITQFRCENNHSGASVRCAPHGQDSDAQICGYCAERGESVRAVVRITGHL